MRRPGLGLARPGARALDPARGARRMVLQIVVHDLEQARTALGAAQALGVAIELRSAPDAAAYAGVGYLKALGELAGQELLIDCGDDPGLVMAALRTGCRQLTFSGAADTARRLRDMAAQAGATLVHETTTPAALELAPGADAGAALSAWLRPREP